MVRGIWSGQCRVEAIPVGRSGLQLEGLQLEGLRLRLELQLTPQAEGEAARSPLLLVRRGWPLAALGALLVALFAGWWSVGRQPSNGAPAALHDAPTPSPVLVPLSALPEPPPDEATIPAEVTAPPQAAPPPAPALRPLVELEAKGEAPSTSAEPPKKPQEAAAPSAAPERQARRTAPAERGSPARPAAARRAADADLLELFGDTK